MTRVGLPPHTDSCRSTAVPVPSLAGFGCCETGVSSAAPDTGMPRCTTGACAAAPEIVGIALVKRSAVHPRCLA
jgi:hypothetical protein